MKSKTGSKCITHFRVIDPYASGRVLAAKRLEFGYTQEELASVIFISRQAVSKWERGSLPDSQWLDRLAQLYGCSMNALIVYREEDPTSPASGAISAPFLPVSAFKQQCECPLLFWEYVCGSGKTS